MQLIVLCKCHIFTAHRLLQLNASLRSLFLCYPESCLQKIVHQIPRPAVDLLRASWAVDNVDISKFDSRVSLDLLKDNRMVDYSSVEDCILADEDDSLDVLEGLADLFEEVKVTENLLGQSLHVAVQTFIRHWEQIHPIILSTDESLRISSAL